MTKEIWKEIAGYEGKYWVSNLGRIKSNYLGETIFHPAKDRLGYLQVGLSLNNKSHSYKVHKLVALHFVPNPRGLNEINHIDGNKENNRWDNLEWCTRSENIRHAYDNGLIIRKKGINNPCSKVFFQFDLQGNIIKIWKGVSECARTLLATDENVQKEYLYLHSLRSNITACLNGRHKSCCGYIFSFDPDIDLNDYKWKEQESTPVIATDKKTGEEFNYKSIHSLDNFTMPNGQTVFATLICKVCKGKRKTHGGYYWRYK